MQEYLNIPEHKEFFSIGEVSRITQMPQHTLRYWEHEFSLLRPQRRATGHRKYTRHDIEQIARIKDLVYSRKFTIAGAKKYLAEEKRKGTREPEQSVQGSGAVQLNAVVGPVVDQAAVSEIIHEVEDIIKSLR